MPLSNASHQDSKPLPQHVAIIMDGNRRWAKERNLSEIQGHKAGINSLKNAVEFAIKQNIKILTVYAFSKENWKRGPQWIKEFFLLFTSTLHDEINELHENGVKITFIGDRSEISKELHSKISESENLTQNNKALHLVIAFNYSGRNEIVRAIQSILSKGLPPNQIHEDTFHQYLDTKDLPDPDLVIRTSGEFRISNFLLWQMSYSEFVFIDKLWPDFDQKDFQKALNEYAKRDRRYGRTNA